MARKIHLVLGIALSLFYLFLLSHLHRILPGLELNRPPLPVAIPDNSAFGWFVAFGLPIVAIMCFVAPDRLMRWFSPRIPPDYDYLLTPDFRYFVGYFALIVGIGVLLLFRTPPVEIK